MFQGDSFELEQHLLSAYSWSKDETRSMELLSILREDEPTQICSTPFPPIIYGEEMEEKAINLVLLVAINDYNSDWNSQFGVFDPIVREN